MGEMYKPQNNGPHTMLAATINASQVSITVENASILPDAPNVLTIGTDEDAELVKLESKTGNILSVTRGFNGTTPKEWDSGVWIYRAITAQDIEELQERTKKIVKTLTATEFEALTTEELAALYASGVRTVLVEQTGEAGSDPIYLRVDVAQSLTNAQKATALTSIGAAAAIRNAVDNSDFRHWVAQAGIGGNHGEVAYGGDRWILDSGSITGIENTNGLGYGSITLNGTIRQIIEEPQETMTAFVGMISGTATVAYTFTDGEGELTISSAGGMLDWVMLLPGEWASAPPYVPKGYVTEFVECQKYFVSYGGESTTFCGIGLSQGADMFDVVLPLTTPMRCKPSMSCIGTITAANGVHIDITAEFGVEAQNGLSLFLRANKDSAFEAGKSYLLRIPAGSMLHICADL